MDITLVGDHFSVIDAKDRITVADCFVLTPNKIGTAHGEAKLYIGQNNIETSNFFGDRGFSVSCFLLKSDLLKYLEQTKVEYLNPEQPYINKGELPALWNYRLEKVKALQDKIEFKVIDQAQIAGSRVYVNSRDIAYELIRELSLPNITYISVIKLMNDSGQLEYYFRLFADYFGDVQHPYMIEKEIEEIEAVQDVMVKRVLTKARVGQGKYRENLLKQCPFCPITLVADDRMLIASHIKPWAKSSQAEKIDPKNGFMLTPTFDLLFDRGYLSFTNEKRAILSPFLSNMTYSKIGITDNQLYTHLPIEGREEYLEYHRNEILKR